MDQSDKARKVFSYYWKHIRNYPRYVAGIALALPLTVLLNNYLPALILADVLSRLSQHDYQEHQIWSSFGSSLILFLLILLAGMIMWRIIDFFTWRLEGKINKDIAEEVLSHMIDQSTDFHANNFTGSLVSKTNKLLCGYIRTADTTIFQTYPLFAGIVIAAIILMPKSPLFTIILVIFSAFWFLFWLL